MMGIESLHDAMGWFCHQLPERSLMVEGMQLPLCARCTGLYGGFALGLLCQVGAGHAGVQFASRVRAIAVLALAVLVLQGAGERWAGMNSTNPTRLLLGLAGGTALSVLLVPYSKAGRELPDPAMGTISWQTFVWLFVWLALVLCLFGSQNSWSGMVLFSCGGFLAMHVSMCLAISGAVWRVLGGPSMPRLRFKVIFLAWIMFLAEMSFFVLLRSASLQ